MKESNETTSVKLVNQLTNQMVTDWLKLNRLGIALRHELANSAPPVPRQLNLMYLPKRPCFEATTDIPMNNNFSGWFGERATAWGLSCGLDSKHYLCLNDLIIPNGKGGTAQIDHAVLSQFGIFVIEVKNRNGRIVGKPEERQWQQTSNGRTYYFQNPLWQNDEHIRALANWLNLRWSAFYSIVFFCGDARFGNPMPANVRTHGVTTVIKSKKEATLTREEVLATWNTLQACKRNGNLSLERHQRYVNQVLGNNTRL